MPKIKICGLRSPKDIEIVNRYQPDYAGFIIDFPKSFRSLEIDEVSTLTSKLDPSIQSVGVFVNEDIEVVKRLLNEKVIDIAQLHGSESESYIHELKEDTKKCIIKAFTIHSIEDVELALQSSADYILLDQGKGSGQTFDWSLVPDMKRPFFLAGGLDENNLEQAKHLHPYAFDLSSGVETYKIKDENKIRNCIDICRKENKDVK